MSAFDERNWPSELVEFIYALNRLHIVGYVKSDRWLGAVGGGGSSEWGAGPDQDPRRQRFRSSYQGVLGDLRLMTKRIKNMFPKDSEAIEIYEQLERRRQSWRCPACKKRGRPQARYCDQCGTAKPEQQETGA